MYAIWLAEWAGELREGTSLAGSRVNTDAPARFLHPEAVANQIAKRPRAELLDVAKACKKQKHSQAKSAGKRAIAAIEALE